MVNRTITYVSIILVDYLSSEVFGMIFLSDYRIVEEKKRYEKLNDAAYSALKCRDCAASDWFKTDTYRKLYDRRSTYHPSYIGKRKISQDTHANTADAMYLYEIAPPPVSRDGAIFF